MKDRKPEDLAGGDEDRSARGPAPGRSSRTQPSALAQALARQGGGGPATAGDAAQAAVDGKGSGAPVDSGVRAAVEPHVGADLGGVRVHSDPLSQQATAAMGARAFAHRGDVFLGTGESPTDTALMAHELTHVVQQGAAGAAFQRRLEVGAADSPAERQADAVAGQVTAGAAPAALLVEDDVAQLAPGQMRKRDFLAALEPAVRAAADQELGPLWSVVGCPYLDHYMALYRGRSAAHCERALRRFAPGVAGATTASALIPPAVARVREGVRAWTESGRLPADLDLDPSIAAAAGPPAEAGSPAQLKAQLGPGQPIDAAQASRMGDALGADVSQARIHTGETAARIAADHDARALTFGNDVVMGAGQPGVGTIEGDALLAHELAHTVQQKGAAGADADVQRKALPGESGAMEADADQAAAGAVARLWAAGARIAENAGPALTSGFELQRCSRDTPQQAQSQQTPQQTPQTPQPAPQVPPARQVDPWVQSMIDFMGTQDRSTIQRIVNDHVRIVRFTTAYDTWEYDDGRVVREELTGLRGNTDADTSTIRIRASLGREQAAVTLFHEMNHWGRPETTTQQEYLDEEVDVRVQSELFAIRHGLPETRPGYRNPDGTVNRQAIRDSVYGSSHYNPSGRHRINREYEGEAVTSGWYVPTTP